MKTNDTKRAQCEECNLIAELFHTISQPLTALEVGLEISLRHDNNVAQLRSRLESALGIAQTLHRRLVEIRGLIAQSRDPLGGRVS